MVTVMVNVSMPRLQVMQDAKETIPSPATGTFLLDTGASGTAIDPDLIAPLNVPKIGEVAITTPSTEDGNPHVCDQYDVSLFFPGQSASGVGFWVPALPIITTRLKHQGIDGLIGRDVLNRCTLTYIGSAGIYSLSW